MKQNLIKKNSGAPQFYPPNITLVCFCKSCWAFKQAVSQVVMSCSKRFEHVKSYTSFHEFY